VIWKFQVMILFKSLGYIQYKSITGVSALADNVFEKNKANWNLERRTCSKDNIIIMMIERQPLTHIFVCKTSNV